ncbi:Peptidase C65 Otubain domain containing protein [Amanita muscaria]
MTSEGLETRTESIANEVDEKTAAEAKPQAPGSQLEEVTVCTALSGVALADLSHSQLIDLNQNALNDLVPNRPLIEGVEPISALRAEYESGSPRFRTQIDGLTDAGFHFLRRARGDGDCFYRAVGFAFVEQILGDQEQDMAVASALSLLESSLEWLDAVGFQRLVYEDFYDTLCGLIQNIATPEMDGSVLTEATLLDQFQHPEASNSIVAFLRLLTSSHLRLNEEEYSPFLFHPELGEPMNVREFCENFVEGSGKEADHVQITALCRILRLNVKVAYLDGRSDTVDFVDFQNDSTSKRFITLLYRPGHYDILLTDDGSPSAAALV